MKIIENKNMFPPNGHYSQCIEHNGILYLSGQLPITRYTKEIPNTIAEQILLTLNNIESILLDAGSDKQQILQVRIYIVDVKLWDEVNAIYANFFGTHKPVRCIIPTNALHYGASIEIEVTAILKNSHI